MIPSESVETSAYIHTDIRDEARANLYTHQYTNVLALSLTRKGTENITNYLDKYKLFNCRKRQFYLRMVFGVGVDIIKKLVKRLTKYFWHFLYVFEVEGRPDRYSSLTEKLFKISHISCYSYMPWLNTSCSSSPSWPLLFRVYLVFHFVTITIFKLLIIRKTWYSEH